MAGGRVVEFSGTDPIMNCCKQWVVMGCLKGLTERYK